ncbi:MAG: hypothetical protein HC869_21245, partial [Rhodospirillales bacterium]|nr:hypothetical protein [Rhodospirillales bacterium]
MRPWRLGPLDGRARAVQWAYLLAASIILVAVAEFLHLPAALLLGPMLAALLVGSAEATIRVPPYPFIAAQALIGCMIGRSIPISMFDELIRDWPLFLMGIVAVMAAASTLGWLLARWNVLPGTTAIWGTSPGASTPMILMSEAYGADAAARGHQTTKAATSTRTRSATPICGRSTVAAALEHPGIVAAHEYREACEAPCLIMRLVGKETLRHR